MQEVNIVPPCGTIYIPTDTSLQSNCNPGRLQIVLQWITFAVNVFDEGHYGGSGQLIYPRLVHCVPLEQYGFSIEILALSKIIKATMGVGNFITDPT